MRDLLVLVLSSGLVAAPLSVSAQGGDEEEAAESEDTRKPARGLQRWHPEAFVDPVTGEPVAAEGGSNFEIEYAPAQSQPNTEEGRRKGISRGGKIAIGVLVPLVVFAVVGGAVVGASLSRDPLFE